MRTSIINRTGLEQEQNKMLLFMSGKKIHLSEFFHLSEFNRQFYNF